MAAMIDAWFARYGTSEQGKILTAYRAGGADWDTTRDALAALPFRTDDTDYHDPVYTGPDSNHTLSLAMDLGVLTVAQYTEVVQAR